MRYVTAIVGAAVIFAAAFFLVALFTNYSSIGFLINGQVADFVRVNVGAAAVGGLLGASSFFGTLRYYRKQDQNKRSA